MGLVFKSYALRDWARFGELFGQPIRVGKYHQGASPEDVAVLKQAAFSLGSDAAAVIPQEMVLELVESGAKSASTKLYHKLIDYLDRQASKAVLGQTMTTDDGSSLAQARVHAEVRADILRAATTCACWPRPAPAGNLGAMGVDRRARMDGRARGDGAAPPLHRAVGCGRRRAPGTVGVRVQSKALVDRSDDVRAKRQGNHDGARIHRAAAIRQAQVAKMKTPRRGVTVAYPAVLGGARRAVAADGCRQYSLPRPCLKPRLCARRPCCPQSGDSRLGTP
nr:DUF935 family protein [Fontimonas thermophila]